VPLQVRAVRRHADGADVTAGDGTTESYDAVVIAVHPDQALRLPAAAAAFAVRLVTFAVAVRAGVHRIVDVAWGIGFTAVAGVTFALSTGEGDLVRRLLVTSLTAVWGLRLAVHIGRRGRGHGEDPRYEAMPAKAPGSRNAYALRMVSPPSCITASTPGFVTGDVLVLREASGR